MSYNSIVLVGPTAVGKTAIGVRLAHTLNGEILSADSRQVYKGLDIGSGKDLSEYNVDGFPVPYHIIDVCDLSKEYNLFDFQNDFYSSFKNCLNRNKVPVCVGGTGLYVDAVVRSYDMIPTPENPQMEAELRNKSYEELKAILIAEKEKLHNTTEFGDSERLIKAIMINRFNISDECKRLREEFVANKPPVNPLILGTTLERSLVRGRISRRLQERLDNGLIEEVESLNKQGWSFERMESLGLEYRFVSQYLQGKIETKEKLYELLNIAIGQFAKRQETFFRCMEKKGVKINWLPQVMSVEERYEAALRLWNEGNRA